MSVEVQFHTVPNFKGLISGIEDVGVLWCDSTFILCYSILNTAILLHKWGLVKFHYGKTVYDGVKICSFADQYFRCMGAYGLGPT